MATCSYVLPFRRARFSAAEMADLAAYFESLRGADCEILAIDGSPPAVFEQNRALLASTCRHAAVDRQFGCLNDKVNGVHTGVRLAGCEKIILADDDIRYTAAEIRTILELLEECEVVRPQNYLSPLPWWARMEAARMLINRATLRTADYPGTCAFRKTIMLRAGAYDGDVLFDNEELLRHLSAAGASINYATDLFVRKRPPTFRKWLEQRPRQAYEDFGLRAKTVLFAALVPALLLLAMTRGFRTTFALFLLLSFAAVVLAFRGRARGRAAKYFPLSTCFHAPLWLWERALSTYWAFYWFFKHGGYPFGDRLLTRGIGRSWNIGGRIAARQVRATVD